mgnify:CR=1 FL=1
MAFTVTVENGYYVIEKDGVKIELNSTQAREFAETVDREYHKEDMASIIEDDFPEYDTETLMADGVFVDMVLDNFDDYMSEDDTWRAIMSTSIKEALAFNAGYEEDEE